MSTIVWKYDLDLSGANPNNLVSGEVHEIPLAVGRAFATNYGPFYSDSAVVKVKDTGVVLTNGTDYECLYMYPEATARSGKPVMAVVHILNASVVGDVLIDYQVVGGEYSSNAYALEQIIAALAIDNRAITWANVLNKPVTFPPEPHLHAATDLYGFEYLVDALNDITSAILLGDVASHDQIYLRIANVKKLLQDDYNAQFAAMTARVNQLQSDMESGFLNHQNQINALSSVVTAHINNKNNPHEVTYVQTQAVPITRTVNGKALDSNVVLNAGDVGAYSKTEIDGKVATLQDTDTTLQNNINVVSQALAVHINNKNNPHQVTAFQSGAVPITRTVNGKALDANIVLNYADVGAYSTGQIDAKVTALNNTDGQLQTNINTLSNVVTTHINNRANPHQVTAQQSGSVPVTRTVNGMALSQDINITTINPGTIIMWGGATPPIWGFELNGQTFDQWQHPKLFAALGSSQVPDFRGYFVRAWAHGSGIDPDFSRPILSIQADDFKSHNHGAPIERNPSAPASQTGNMPGSAWGGSRQSNTTDAGTGYTGGLETRPKNIAVMYIIKNDW